MGGEGSMGPEITAQPEAPRNPTEASRGFLGKMANGAKELGITLVAASVPGGYMGLGIRRAVMEAEARSKTENPAIIERPTAAETVRPTTTEVSNNFLERLRETIEKHANPWVPIATAVALNTLSQSPVKEDIIRGDYRSVAVKGIIVAASAMLPTVARVIGGRR